MAPHRILNVLDEKNGQERVDNLLTCFKNITWNQAEKIRKEVLKIFKKQTSKLSILNYNLKPFNEKIPGLQQTGQWPFIYWC